MRERRSLRTGIWGLWARLWFLAGLVAGAAEAEPIDLRDVRARWIEVRFEVSPSDQPGTLDRSWSRPRRAYLEPVVLEPAATPDRGILDGAGLERAATLVQIRIPAAEIEAHLRSTGTDTVPGSFSEFVWILDPESGHVRRADLSGRVREEIRLGPFRSSAQIEISVEMNTERDGGFEPGHGILGIPTHRFCTPAASSTGPSAGGPAVTRNPGERVGSAQEDCVGVPPVPFDPERGYVNAVGSVLARTAITQVRAFSPLGEVEFLEQSVRGTESVVSGTSEPEALCSGPFIGPCAAGLGGES